MVLSYTLVSPSSVSFVEAEVLLAEADADALADVLVLADTLALLTDKETEVLWDELSVLTVLLAETPVEVVTAEALQPAVARVSAAATTRAISFFFIIGYPPVSYFQMRPAYPRE